LIQLCLFQLKNLCVGKAAPKMSLQIFEEVPFAQQEAFSFSLADQLFEEVHLLVPKD